MKNSLSLLLLSLLWFSSLSLAEDNTGIAECTKIVDDKQRLACFDKVAGTPLFAINPVMAPTCYISQTRTPACGPSKQCDPAATGIKGIEGESFSCYVLGDKPNCCNYCPPQWSASC